MDEPFVIKYSECLNWMLERGMISKYWYSDAEIIRSKLRRCLEGLPDSIDKSSFDDIDDGKQTFHSDG